MGSKQVVLREPQIATVDDVTFGVGESVVLTDDQVKRLQDVEGVKLDVSDEKRTASKEKPDDSEGGGN